MDPKFFKLCKRKDITKGAVAQNDKVDVYILLIENVDKAKGSGAEEIILKSNFSVELCVVTTENNQVYKKTYNLSSNDMTIEEPAKFICRRLLYNNIHLLKS